MICALVLLAKDGSLKKVFKEWTLVGSLTASGLPAAIYALQNSLLQISYKNLDSLTFSMLNQTKLFFTALFTFIILRYFPIWISCISERSQFSNFCCIIYHIILEVTDSVYFHIFLVTINAIRLHPKYYFPLSIVELFTYILNFRYGYRISALGSITSMS